MVQNYEKKVEQPFFFHIISAFFLFFFVFGVRVYGVRGSKMQRKTWFSFAFCSLNRIFAPSKEH